MFKLLLTTLSLAALTLPGPAQAKILMRDSDGGGTLAVLAPEPTGLEGWLIRANFTAGDATDYGERRGAVMHDLQELGFQPGWQMVLDEATLNVWYAPALNVTVVCAESAGAPGYTHVAYVLEGWQARHQYLSW